MLKLELVQTDKHSIKILLRRKNLRFLRRTNHYTNTLATSKFEQNMKKIILLLIFSFLITISTKGQNADPRILYVIDSIPIINEPEEGLNSLSPDQIDKLMVYKGEKAIDSLGYKDLDGVIYIFTKEYVKRPDSIKRIPSSNNMERKNYEWYLKNSSNTYSGKFIDYYLDGKKQGEGNFKNGKVDGVRKMYYPNGQTLMERVYSSGLENGLEKEYYEDGTLKQKGDFLNGKENGVWEMFHPNGQLKQKVLFDNGELIGESIGYYSTGKINFTEKFNNGIAIKDKENSKKNDLYLDGINFDKMGDFKSSIKKYTKAIELDSTFANGYFARGTAKLNNLEFDEAIIDFNKTLEIEPFFAKAFGNRAFALIRKYEFANSRTLSENSEITILATKDEVEIPESVLEKICADLTKSYSLGIKNKMISDAKEKFCK